MTRNRKDRKTRRPKRPKGAAAVDSQPEPETSTTPKPVFDRTQSDAPQSSKKPFTSFTRVQSHPGKKPRLFEDGTVANTSQDPAAPAQHQLTSNASVDHNFELDVWGRRLDSASLTRGNSGTYRCLLFSCYIYNDFIQRLYLYSSRLAPSLFRQPKKIGKGESEIVRCFVVHCFRQNYYR